MSNSGYKIMLMDEQVGWNYNPEQADEPAGYEPTPSSHAEHSVKAVTWTGSEFIARHKTATWYFGLAGVTLLLTAIIYFVSKDLATVVFVAIVALLFGFIASRKPRQLSYLVNQNGLQVGNKSYIYSDFLSFSLQRDGGIGYISFLPIKRLHNELSIYYPPDQEQEIFDTLSDSIPYQQRKEGLTDKLIRLIQF